MAYVTATVTVWDADPRIADEKLRLVEKVVQGRDFTGDDRDDQRGRCLARLAARARLRQRPAAADLDAQSRPHDPASAVWAGPARTSIWCPAAVRQDRRLDPFRFFLHVGDVGHTLVVGPTGAGKVGAAGADGALQFRRYAGAQVFAFDFGGSIRAAALAMGGGDWHDLGGGLTEGRVRLAAAARAHSRDRRTRLGRRLDRRDP